MITRLLLGAGAVVTTLGLSAPVIVSSLAARGEGLASHRDGRGAPVARRDDQEYREYLSEEQRSQRGPIARRMQPDLYHGLLSPIPHAEPRPPAASENNSPAAEGPRRSEEIADAGFLGVVVALQSVELSARFDGTLERLNVHVGDHVTGGMAIAQLDSRSVARDLAMAEASLRGAEAEHDRSVVELEDASDRRARLHLIPELVPREQLTAAESQEKVAAARLRSAVADLAGKRARIEQLKETLRDTQIIAPFDGTIAARYVDSGTTVSRSAPIVRVISQASLVIRFAVPEEEAAGVAVGREVVVCVASAGVTVDGVIERIAPEIDAALRMVVVEARLTGNAGRTAAIPSGAIARVLLAANPNHLGRGAASAHPSISDRDGGTGHDRTIH